MQTSIDILEPGCLDRLSQWRDSGALFVTPNNRLARHLDATFAQMAQPCFAYERVEVLPFDRWAASLWEQAMLLGQVKASHLLTDFQDLQHWRAVIDRSAVGEQLVAVPAAARLAQRAFHAVLSYRLDIDAHRFEFLSDVDSAAFLDWQAAYSALLEEHNQLPLVLAQQHLLDVAQWPGRQPVVAVGFDQLTPLQQAMLDHVNRDHELPSNPALQLEVRCERLLPDPQLQ